MNIRKHLSVRLLTLLTSKIFLVSSAILIISQILYVFNVGLLFVPLMAIVYALLIPMPSIFRSIFSKSVVGGLIFYAFYQIIAIMQFLVLPDSGFTTTAVGTTVLSFGLILLVGRVPVDPKALFTKEDVFGILTASFFVIPIALYCISGGITQRVTSIGSIQGNDGATHFSILSDTTTKEHMAYYNGGGYYPYGFHLSTGFIEESFSIGHPDSSWKENVRLYIGEYLAMASLLAYSLYFLVLQLLSTVRRGKALTGGRQLLVGLSLGPPLAVLYAVPFLYHGFLNYYYVCATIAIGLIMLIAGYLGTNNTGKKTGPNAAFIFIGLLLLFGASSSWPLFVPIILLIAGLFVIPRQINRKVFSNIRFNKLTVLLVLGLVLQILPLYLQLSYSNVSTSEGLNMAGGLRVFNSLFLLLGTALVAYTLLSQKYGTPFKEAISNVYVPILISVSALAAYQYFSIGEIRYYVIKLSIFLEIFLLVLLVALVVDACEKAKLTWLNTLLLVVMLPTLVFFSVYTVNDNPLKESRNLLRSHSGQPKPAYFDSDVQKIAELGNEGSIENFNVITLHYDAVQKKIFTHTQTAYWANSISFDGETKDYVAKACYYKTYTNLLLGNFTDAEQVQLIDDVKQCAALAKTNKEKYFIVTDKDSSEQIRSIFQDDATIVW